MNSPFPSSIDYRQSIFTLTNALNQLLHLSQKLNLENLIELISDRLNHLDDNRFSIGIFGNFNCGKSTFINALIGEDILPSDILATTATYSRINHRQIPGAKIRFRDGTEKEIAIEKLAEYVTKLTSESSATAARIKEAVVYYPIPYCKNNNIEIIDTPGLNDDEQMTALTFGIINQCDVAIMLISTISPFSISEAEFLTTKLLNNGIYRVLFIVNAIDLLNSPEDIERVVNLIVNRIENSILEWANQQSNSEECLKKIGKIRVFGISATQALQAKQANNIPLLAESRFVNFEYALKTLINQERGLIQLQLTANRIVTYTAKILQNIENQESELEQEQTKLKNASRTINEKITIIRSRKTAINASVDNTLTSIKQQAQISYYQLETEVKSAAIQVIESTTINASELNKLPSKILDAVQSATNRIAIQIHKDTQKALNVSLQHLKNLAELLDEVIPKLNQEMSQIELDTKINNQVIDIVRSVHQFCNNWSQKQSSTLSLVFPSNSEIFGFADNPNGSGTALGAVIGFVLTAGNPLGGAVGSAIGAAVGENIKKKNLKEKYQPQVMAAIEEQLKLMNVNQTVDDYTSRIVSQVDSLQSLFIKGVNSMVDTNQNRLAALCGQCEAMGETKQRELSQIREQVEKIRDDTQKLSEQLSKLSA